MKFVKWDEYTARLERLYQDVQWRVFENIVGIGRGGSLIAAYLASKLGVPTFCPIFVRHVGKGTDMKLVVNDLYKINSLSGRLLVVEDWIVEGRAMTFVLERLPKGTVVTTMTMYCRKGSAFTPEFVGEYVDENEQEISFPYDAMG